MIDSKISSVALEELYKDMSDGFLPVLFDLYNPDINWRRLFGDDYADALGQDNCHLRMINDTSTVKYKGDSDNFKTYIPCQFSYQQPTLDGVKISGASITLSALDEWIVMLLRSLKLKSKIRVVAAFAKTDNGVYRFHKLSDIEFEVLSASYSRTSATLSLSFDQTLQRNFPVDNAVKDRLPSVRMS